MDMVQLRVVVVNMFEQGFLFSFLAFGVLLTFRFFRFPIDTLLPLRETHISNTRQRPRIVG